MYTVPETGLLYFILARSTHIANAYKEGSDIVVCRRYLLPYLPKQMNGLAQTV